MPTYINVKQDSYHKQKIHAKTRMKIGRLRSNAIYMLSHELYTVVMGWTNQRARFPVFDLKVSLIWKLLITTSKGASAFDVPQFLHSDISK